MCFIATGASRGIGQAIAEQMAGEGANLILLAQRKGALEEVSLAGPTDVRTCEGSDSVVTKHPGDFFTSLAPSAYGHQACHQQLCSVFTGGRDVQEKGL